MVGIRESLTEALGGALAAVGVEPPASGIALERPARREHGDWSSNVAMATAKAAGRNPRELAGELIAVLEADPPAHVAAVEIAGPGFVNFRLHDSWLHEVLVDVVSAGADGFARPDLGGGAKVNVEFVSANPTGPMHVAHARGAVVGDALASLLDFAGYAVTREYYINDGGGQVDVLARSAYERYREAHGLSPEIAEGLYPGDYLIPVGEALKAMHGDRLLDQP
ncbi:MAG TPA: arginine--tRNA ligase, partial [Acidimicrobiales bacterium]|nr:arginine--tRNA ligase [Acidimicrobiales bacterium]